MIEADSLTSIRQSCSALRQSVNLVRPRLSPQMMGSRLGAPGLNQNVRETRDLNSRPSKSPSRPPRSELFGMESSRASSTPSNLAARGRVGDLIFGHLAILPRSSPRGRHTGTESRNHRRVSTSRYAIVMDRLTNPSVSTLQIPRLLINESQIRRARTSAAKPGLEQTDLRPLSALVALGWTHV